MQIRTKLLFALAATVTAVACSDSVPPNLAPSSETPMTGTAVVPTAATTTATGVALASIHPGGVFGYSAAWNGLSGVLVGGGHIHGPADAANTGGILITLGTATASGGASQTHSTAASAASAGTSSALDTAHVTATVTVDSLKKLFRAGLLYIDVHTTANAGGELRAQLRP